MKISDLALFGAHPRFEQIIPVGQLYFPSWDRYEEAFRGIFDRQYYTNQGILTQQLEEKLQDFLGVKHVICVTNATIALTMLAQAMQLKGKVILPSFTFIASAQSLTWAGLKPVFCDVDLNSHHIDVEKIKKLIDGDVSAIMGVNLWGGACDVSSLHSLGEKYGLQIYFDSAHGFGCSINGVSLGNFGEAEVFSFHATKILSATEGGCITTNNNMLAQRLRNIRSSYGAGTPIKVDKTANGRMSEAQAAIALLSLEDFTVNRNNNERLFYAYESRLYSVPGLHLLKPEGVDFSNYQYVVCRIDKEDFGITRDLLIDVLKAENIAARRYFYPGVHRSVPYSYETSLDDKSLMNTDILCASCIQLPIGARVLEADVMDICEIIINAHRLCDNINFELERKN